MSGVIACVSEDVNMFFAEMTIRLSDLMCFSERITYFCTQHVCSVCVCVCVCVCCVSECVFSIREVFSFQKVLKLASMATISVCVKC